MKSLHDSEKFYFLPLLVICIALLVAVAFYLAPYLWDTLVLAKEYNSQPDHWVFYAVLAGCAAAFLGAIFMFFNRYIPHDRKKGGLEQE
jgi:hypothetical protein